MIQEEIARLTGTLKFNVDARPLITFEKRLAKVTGMLNDFSKVANKKFQIKVSLDSRTLRAQLEKAANAKVVFKNFTVSEEAMAAVATKLANRLAGTPIKLKNVKIDVSGLKAQDRLTLTAMGRIKGSETELRKWIKDVESRLSIKMKVEVRQGQFVSALKRAIYEAQTKVGAVKIRVADPEVKLKVDRNHIQSQLRQIIQQNEYQVRIRVSGGGQPGGQRATARAAAGGGMAGGLASAGMGFARGALPGLGAAWALGSMHQMNQDLLASQNALKAVSASAEDYASNMAFLEQITMEQGRKMRDVAPAFTSVLASAGGAIGAQGTQDLFRGVMKYSTVMGLDQEAMKGTFRAIGQMFSKDKIQAEEAQGQLAERLPAAMQLLAEANNTTVKELREQMQKGELDPKKILPEMARIMETLAEKNGSYARALESSRVQQGRMNRQFEISVKQFADAGFDQGMGRFFRAISEGLVKAEPAIKALGEAFLFLVEPVNAAINLVAILGNALVKLGESLGLTGGEFYALIPVFWAFISPIGAVVAGIAGLILVLEDLATFAEGGDSLFGRWLQDTPAAQEAFDGLKESAALFAENVKNAWDYALKLAGSLEGLTFSDVMITTMKELKALLDAFNALVQRATDAGMFAKETGGGNPLEETFRSIQGLILGKEGTDKFLTEQYTAEQMSPENLKGHTSSRSLTPDELAGAVAAAILRVESGQDNPKVPTTLTVPVTIESGMTQNDMGTFFQERIQAAAQQALYDWADRARARQKDIK